VNESSNNNIARWAILALVLFTLALLAWLKLRPTLLPTQITPASVSPNASPLAISSQTPNAQTEKGRLQKPGGPYAASDPRWAIVREKDKLDHNWEWRMPINFYGRVVDENDRPIPSAKIEFSWTDLSSAGNSTSATLSDSAGTFSLESKTGRVLQVDVSRDGYYKPRNERLKSFDYAGFWELTYHEADPARPVIFHLRSKGKSETLSMGEVRPSLPADGTPTRLNLLNGGRVSADGQIEIAAVTNTEKYPPRSFDWQASVTVPDGGLIEHVLEFPFEAPTEGYVPKIDFTMPANSPDWRRTVEKTYFIRFGNPPKYGRIHMRLNGASQKVSLSYAVNLTGSRNLEAYTDEQYSTP
jgi:hypothetical protein